MGGWNIQVRGQHLLRSQSVTSGALRFNPTSRLTAAATGAAVRASDL